MNEQILQSIDKRLESIEDRLAPNPLNLISVSFNSSSPTTISKSTNGKPINWFLNCLITGVINVYFSPVLPSPQQVPDMQFVGGNNAPIPVPIFPINVENVVFEVDPKTPNNAVYGCIKYGQF